jgi:hypothetical protein
MAVEVKPASVQWMDSLEDALATAKETGKLVLLDFFNPG